MQDLALLLMSKSKAASTLSTTKDASALNNTLRAVASPSNEVTLKFTYGICRTSVKTMPEAVRH